MIELLASLATRIGSAVGAWIESAYVLDCTEAEDDCYEMERGAGHDLAWLPALSGVTVASAQAIQSHAGKVHSRGR